MDFARNNGCGFYYPAYAFHPSPSMDYKKQFAGAKWFDWSGNWLAMEAWVTEPSASIPC